VEADIIFLDPPYPKEAEYQTSLDIISAKPPALTIVQHATRYAIPHELESMTLTRTVKQGDNALSFFVPK
jgi:16S rRNA G966 N2-methylase RsmD